MIWTLHFHALLFNILTGPHTSTTTSAAMLMTAPAHTRTFATTTTATATISTTSMITHTAKEATIATDWIAQGMCYARDTSVCGMNIALPCTFNHSKSLSHADSIVMGIIFSCTFLLILITLTVMVYYFIRKNTIVKQNKRAPGVVFSWCWQWWGKLDLVLNSLWVFYL